MIYSKGMLAFGVGACLMSGPAQAADPDIAKKFIGAWKLVGSTQVMADGTMNKPERYNTVEGYIMYTADKHMCAVLHDTKSPKWKDVEKPTDAEKIAAKDGFWGYCGTYEINAAEETIVHHVEFDHVPNFNNTDRKRKFVMHDGNQVDMVVIDPPPPPGTKQRWLTWEKMPVPE